MNGVEDGRMESLGSNRLRSLDVRCEMRTWEFVQADTGIEDGDPGDGSRVRLRRARTRRQPAASWG